MLKRKNKLFKQNIFKKIRYKYSDLRFRYYIWRDIKKGYIAENGKPLKCYKCDSKDLEEYGHYYEEHWCIEYGVKCKHCGQKLGYWAYGRWEMN
jgi:hypothetical protein